MGFKRPLTKRARVARPTYDSDRVGEIHRWDERDVLFARSDLLLKYGKGSPEYEAYYKEHPEHLEYDRKVTANYGLGKTGGMDTPMYTAQFESVAAIASESFVDGEPATHKTVLQPSRAAEKVKAFAALLGADLAGIGPLKQEWVYSHVGRAIGRQDDVEKRGGPVDLSHHMSAVALGFQMDYRLIQSAPDFPVILATAKAYAASAWASVELARYIRSLGYSARAHHLYNYRIIAVPVAVDCGLGELSRAGFLITRELGLGLRLSAVTTNMPLEYDGPVDIGIQSFCERCVLCAECCPSGAIPKGGKTEHNGVRKWKLDEEKCYLFWQSVGTDCSLCMANCPWTKPPTRLHRFMATIAGIAGPHQSFMVWADRVFYGRSRPAKRPDFLEPQPSV